MRWKIQVLGWTLIWSGVLVFGYLGWQLFGTDLVTGGRQDEAQIQLEASISDADLPPAQVIDSEEFLGGPSNGPSEVTFQPEEEPERGAPVGFLRIPKIDVDQVLFEGVDRTTLKSGPGHMEGTPLPGQPGNAVLSGHRTTYGRPFFDFDLLVVGDRIEVETFSGTHTYEVRESMVVSPTDVWVVEDRPGGWLTLTTCNPKFSARERLVVWAEMVDGPNYEYIQLHEARFGA